MIQVGKSILVIVNWRADYGRTYFHAKDTALCLTCPPWVPWEAGQEEGPAGQRFYTDACRQDNHKRHQITHTTLEETRPEEAKLASRLYGKLYRSFQKLGYACGDQVYLVGEGAPLEETKSNLRTEFDAANAGFQVCHVGFDLKEIVLVPGELNEETLQSIRKDVESAIDKMLVALRSGDLKAIRAGSKEVRQVGAVLAGDSKVAAGTLADFAQIIAKRLKDAADEGDAAIERVVEEAKSGAARFAAIFADEDAAESETASAPPGTHFVVESEVEA